MSEVRIARDYFLWSLSVIYLFAFGSIYYQVPGLYGDKGILPIHLILRPGNTTFQECYSERPTILCAAPDLKLDPQSMMEILTLIGVIISFLAIVTYRMRTTVTFALLWAAYFSTFQVGQTFLWFQWDTLLLETGFLAILVAPWSLKTRRETLQPRHHDVITFWLVRWLLFRFMFSSGVVKLTSQCPTWWGLTALQYHFESQCIPTPVAWFAHHLPKWLLKLGVVGTFFLEIPVPFLFFAPLKSMQLFSFACQVIFQFMIILTGNYNFFNLLTITLCLSLLDDNYFGVFYEYQFKAPNWSKYWIMRYTVDLAVKILEWVVFFGLLYWTTALFGLQLLPNFIVESKIAFSYQTFTRTLDKALTVSIWIGIISLSCVIIQSLYRSIVMERGLKSKIRSTLYCILFSCVAFVMFAISLVPHTIVHDGNHAKIWPVVRQWHDTTSKLNIVNSYGLFRRMTGLHGRPEIVIEGSHHIDSGWQDFEFYYKPGRIDMGPSVLVPHQPRLDWQMWFAALGKYNHNPWFVNLLYRLLFNHRDVAHLLAHNPFIKTPPKYIRATLYTYRYTAWELKKRKHSNHPRNWWKRKKLGSYFPPMDRKNATLINYLKKVNLWEDKPTGPKIRNKYVRICLRYFRRFVQTVAPSSFLWSLFFAAITIKQFVGTNVLPYSGKQDVAIIVPNSITQLCPEECSKGKEPLESTKPITHYGHPLKLSSQN